MTGPTLSSNRWTLQLALLIAFVTVVYIYQVPNNPAGFYIDESSIAYNAYTISSKGQDEHGTRWPLFFAAFGEYKSPTYIYLLAAVFRITGPSIVAARLLSAAFGLLTGFLLGILAYRITKEREPALLIGLIGSLSPWLFELSRVTLEVAMYPALIALFLVCLWNASQNAKWSVKDIVSLIITLSLLTYSYSIGRLLGPMLAVGLLLFIRGRTRPVLFTLLGYAASLIPALVYQVRHAEALTNRFHYITYITPQRSYGDLALQFVKRYVGNLNPWRIFIWENSKVSEIIHVPGTQPMLITTAVLAGVGVWLVITRRNRDAWWRYILYGLAVSIVPASLTKEYFHMLRLVALPVFLIVVGIPALKWLREAHSKHYRTTLSALFLLTLIQALIFQYQYYAAARSPNRLHTFDAAYSATILEPALAQSERPIYIADYPGVPGYIQAYWYGTLRGLDLSTFTKLPPEESAPSGALVITTEELFAKSEIIARLEPYTLYVPLEPPRVRVPLTDNGFRAALQVLDQPPVFQAGQTNAIRVRIKNISDSQWLARERVGGRYQVSLGNHWLNASGTMITNDDGRAPLATDLKPGEATESTLWITAPIKPGEYLLEIDMLQEGVSWFAAKGSQPVRIPVRVL